MHRCRVRRRPRQKVPSRGPSQLTHSYFRTEPFVETDGLDYFTNERYASTTHYAFMHKLSDIINAGLAAGLTLRRLEEVDHDISCQCADLSDAKANPPQGLYLLWQKA